MRRFAPLLLGLVVLLALLLSGGLWSQDPVPTPAEAEPVEAPQVRPPRAKVPSVTLSRPASAIAPVHDAEPAPPGDPTMNEPEDAGPADIMDVPERERAELVEQAREVFAELDALCGDTVPDGGIGVMAAMTVDGSGLLEVTLSAYDDDGDNAWATEEALPEALASCFDDVLWDQPWPSFEGGVRFALTMPVGMES